MQHIVLGTFLALAAMAVSPSAQAANCHRGLVFNDRNQNGVQDRGEAGIADVAISNGRDIVRSNASGEYRLPRRAGAEVFIIKPAHLGIGMRPDGLPDHWRGADEKCRPFAAHYLPPAPPNQMEVLLFGDPQPKSLTDVDYYRRDIVEPLIGKVHANLGISLGDIVNDDLSLYPAMNAVTAKLGVPWLHVAGNHDLNFDADDAGSLATFRAHYGPDTFAWESGYANFIVLDNVIWQPETQPNYIGGLREDQFTFLEHYLRDAEKSRLLVLSMHIPLFEPAGRDTFRDADRARLFALLREFPHVLLLSAHSHTQQHVFHGAATGWQGAEPLHEYNVGASCGAFWSGIKDAEGIPASTMADGTPNGWAKLTILPAGEYELAYHPARDVGRQIGLHAPKVLRQGAYPAWGVYANVWMGMDDTVVEYRIDGGEWQAMRKVLQADPALLAENARDDEASALRGYDRSPEATPSTHLWRGRLPTDLAVGEHQIDVRAQDRWRGWQHASTVYRLQSAEP